MRIKIRRSHSFFKVFLSTSKLFHFKCLILHNHGITCSYKLSKTNSVERCFKAFVSFPMHCDNFSVTEFSL